MERTVGLYRLPPNVVVVSSPGSSSSSFFSSSSFPSDDEEERDSAEAFETVVFSTMVIVVSADMVKFPIAQFFFSRIPRVPCIVSILSRPRACRKISRRLITLQPEIPQAVKLLWEISALFLFLQACRRRRRRAFQGNPTNERRRRRSSRLKPTIFFLSKSAEMIPVLSDAQIVGEVLLSDVKLASHGCPRNVWICAWPLC